jgi:uncharacterized protein with HEPN domain
MPFKDIRLLLQDILDSIADIEEFVQGMDYAAYLLDSKTQAAVERKLLIVSEAAIRLGEAAPALCPSIDWKDVRGLGNRIRHEYQSIQDEMIWKIVKDDLPPLKAAVEAALASSEATEP